MIEQGTVFCNVKKNIFRIFFMYLTAAIVYSSCSVAATVDIVRGKKHFL